MNKDQDELIWLSQREVLMIDDRDYVSKMMQNDRDFLVPEIARIFALLSHDIKDSDISDRCKNISQASDIYLKQFLSFNFELIFSSFNLNLSFFLSLLFCFLFTYYSNIFIHTTSNYPITI